MRKLLLIVVCCLAFRVLGQEVPDMPNLSGLNVAQAHAVLYERGLRLDPLIVSTNEGSGIVNTIIDQSLAAGETVPAGALISVTVLREYNLELIWQSPEQSSEIFTIVNLTDSRINLERLVFVKADETRRIDTSLWPNELREHQCVQLWPFEVEAGFRLPECQFLQGGGVLSVASEAGQFWRGEGSFYVLQDGLRRAECQLAVGRCQIWVSPSAIAEEFSPYVFFVYNQHELTLYNRSETEWLPLNQLALNNGHTLDDAREWDSLSFSEALPFLAPNQCVHFSDGTANTLVDCVDVASRQVGQDEIFWQSAFTVHSLHGDDISKNCPAAIGNEQTICLLLR